MRVSETNSSGVARLSIIKIGEDSGAISYARSLLNKTVDDPAIEVVLHEFGEDHSTEEVEKLISALNASQQVSGVIGLTPVPDNFRGLYDQIDPTKDVDCQTSLNYLKFQQGEKVPYAPATAEAVLALIPEHTQKVAIVGKGKAVGEPLAVLLEEAGIDYVLLETHPDLNPNWSQELSDSDADVVVGATRVPYCLDAGNLPEDTSLVIDVAYCETTDGKTVGNFDPLQPIVRNIKLIMPAEVGKKTAEILVGHVKDSFRSRVSEEI